MNRYLEFLKSEVGAYLFSRGRKPLRQQWREMRAMRARYKSVPYHYFKHRLYGCSSRPDFMGYLPSNLVRHFRQTFNPPSHLRVLDDKRETVRALKNSGVRCVETLFSIDTTGTVLRGDGTPVAAAAAATALRSHGGRLFIKPIDSRAGLGASRIEAAQVDAALLASMRNALIQPALQNHPAIAALSPGALSTVRACTFLEDDRCTIVAAFLRVSRGGAVVDNWSQGGIAIGIDLSNGALESTGITKAAYGRRTFAAHPDTGIQFASVTLPWWNETLELAGRAARGLSPHTTLGLDIAILADGPILVEANGAADIFGLQEVCGPLGDSILGQRALSHWLGSRRAGRTTSSPGAAA